MQDPVGGQRVPVVRKAVAYVVDGGWLLVFTHAEPEPALGSGLQVPAGSVEPGESAEAAVLRECREESGVARLRVERHLGADRYDLRPLRNEVAHRDFFLLRPTAALPRSWTHRPVSEPPEASAFHFQWIPLARGHVLAGGLGALLGEIGE